MDLIPFKILLFRLQVLGFLLFWQVNDIHLIFKIVHVENVKMKLPTCLYMASSQIYTHIHISLDPLSRSATGTHQTSGQTGDELKITQQKRGLSKIIQHSNNIVNHWFGTPKGIQLLRAQHRLRRSPKFVMMIQNAHSLVRWGLCKGNPEYAVTQQ